MFDDRIILITGGSGSFGRKAVETILQRWSPRKLIVFSRDELKQSEMQKTYSKEEHGCLRYFLGDVRDKNRLHEALRGVDYVIHAAALKQVPACEYNPFEAIKTNVLGAQNLIQAAIGRGVKKVIALSTDKATAPINLYGATKLCSDKLFIDGNKMSGEGATLFSVVRYGNVLGSRGSVVPFFLKQREAGVLPVTDERMTRFSITLQEAVLFTLKRFEWMRGGELFIPKIPSYRILDVAKAIAPDARIDFVGIRPGEKLHECMVTVDDARQTLEYDDCYVVQPTQRWWHQREALRELGGTPCPEGFSYTSDTNSDWLTIEQIREHVDAYIAEHGPPSS